MLAAELTERIRLSMRSLLNALGRIDDLRSLYAFHFHNRIFDD